MSHLATRISVVVWCSLAFASASTGCGLLSEGMWRISDRHHQRDTSESEPVGLTETSEEHRIVADENGVGVVCEQVTRGVERQWSVKKTFRERSIPRSWLYPALIGEVVYGSIASGVIYDKCKDGEWSCNNLVFISPVVLDLAFIAYRYATRKRPKLVHKRYHDVRLGDEQWARARTPIICPPDVRIVAAASPYAGTGLYLHVGPGGRLSDHELSRLRQYLSQNLAARTFAVGPWATREGSVCSYTQVHGPNRARCSWEPTSRP